MGGLENLGGANANYECTPFHQAVCVQRLALELVKGDETQVFF